MTTTPTQITPEMLAEHAKWWRGEAGTRLVLRNAVLSNADLRNAVLSGAVLRNAVLSNADLSNADLRNAVLSGADLSNAVLSGADLRGADLSGAVLSGADLRNAVLRNADGLPLAIPTIENIHQTIYQLATQTPDALDMGSWHTCETTHCRAGWAIHQCGPTGRLLESLMGPSVAAALIYQASDPTLERIPNWITSDEDALADMKRLAELEAVNQGAAV